MQRRWTVGVDGSDDAQSALRWAALMGAALGEEVQPLVAWYVPIPISTAFGRRPIDVDRAGIEATAAYFGDHCTDDIDVPGVTFLDAEVVEGHPADVLVDRSGPLRPVVAGRRGVSGLKHRLLGSTSSDLAVHASGPVVIVPTGSEPVLPGRIVVGFDGSDLAAAALRWAMDVAPPGSTIEALVAIDVVGWKADVVTDADAGGAERMRVEGVLDQVDPDGVVERTFVPHGPHDALTDAFERADLMVVGPRGAGAMTRLILGSISAWLLQTAPCPVAVVPT